MIFRIGELLGIGALASCTSTPEHLVSHRVSNQVGTHEDLQVGAKENGDTMPRALARSVDKYRTAQGYDSLMFDERIARQAQEHSDYLMQQYVRTGNPKLSHKGAKRRFNTIILDCAMSRTAENVACCSKRDNLIQSLTDLWRSSEKHEKNMFSKWTHTGVGVAIAPDGSVFATQIFALKTDYTF